MFLIPVESLAYQNMFSAVFCYFVPFRLSKIFAARCYMHKRGLCRHEVSVNSGSVHRAVYRESCLSQPAWTTYEGKRREQHLFALSGKSEAELTNNRRLRSTYCTIEANY